MIPALEEVSIPAASVYSVASVSVIDGWLVLCRFRSPFLADAAKANRLLIQDVLQGIADDPELRVGVQHRED